MPDPPAASATDGSPIARPARLRIGIAWFGANLVLGYLLLLPLILVAGLIQHVLAEILDAPWSPLDRGEGPLGIAYFVVVVSIPLLLALAAVNITTRSRLALHGWRRVAFYLATTAVVLSPFGLVWFELFTVQQMIGKRWLW